MTKKPSVPKDENEVIIWRNRLLDFILYPPSITVSAVGPTNDVDVNGVKIVVMDTSSGNVTIGGFVNGKENQVIHVVRTSTSNNAVLEHNESTGNQDIFLADEADHTLTTYGGWVLYCNGTHWYEVGY